MPRSHLPEVPFWQIHRSRITFEAYCSKNRFNGVRSQCPMSHLCHLGRGPVCIPAGARKGSKQWGQKTAGNQLWSGRDSGWQTSGRLLRLIRIDFAPHSGFGHTVWRSIYRSSLRRARKASWGISTFPTRFMRFFPSACFSSSLRLRVMSPP
ncbi:MAG: Protein tyrosine/serine phosphatase-like protein (Modular protein) [Dehalococcoidia bacterium]|nr:Protein tyrosine/serine phosphatase-like protein (Modular protein) [Dehalococcoidia bacterium]